MDFISVTLSTAPGMQPCRSICDIWCYRCLFTLMTKNIHIYGFYRPNYFLFMYNKTIEIFP